MAERRTGILHEFDDSVFDALGGDDWHTPFRLYSRIGDKTKVHTHYEDVILEDEEQYRFDAWFVSQQRRKGDGPVSIDQRLQYVMRINIVKFPIGKTLKIGDKLLEIDNGMQYIIVLKALTDRWTNTVRFTCEEAI